MKKYHSEGGRTDPGFPHEVRVRQCNTEMYEWCEAYDDQGRPFCRFYVRWDYHDAKGYDIVQFEQEAPAVMFALTFGKL